MIEEIDLFFIYLMLKCFGACYVNDFLFVSHFIHIIMNATMEITKGF